MKPLPVPWLIAVFGLAVACGPQIQRPDPPPASARPKVDASAVESSPPRLARAPARIERKATGQETPTLAVKNQFPIAQYVFLDAKPLGEIKSGGSATFEVPAGVHSVTSADSSNQDDNPVSITERFESGFGYSYEITPE